MSVQFIPEDIVLIIHTDLIQRYGGSTGVRDKNLLESAIAQPKITVSGKYANKTIFDKAATYGFHICMNHPFVDGNKRVAFALMDIFLQKNGWDITAGEEEAYSTMMTLASGKLSKSGLSTWLKEHTSKTTLR